MPKSLMEYADWLAERDDLIWPVPPPIDPVKAKPALEPLPEVRAVTWSVYGTLLRISDGRLLFDHPVPLRMQVALDKTIHEFNMWNSLTRKPGPPWQSLLPGYQRLLDEQRLGRGVPRGDFVEVDAPAIWKRVLGWLKQKDYRYDERDYGDEEQYSQKIAYFFHSCLQGIEIAPDALVTLEAVSQSHVQQTLLADAQIFTIVQLLRELRTQATLPRLDVIFRNDCMTLSFQEGVCKPSASLYRTCLARFAERGIQPHEILHVGSRLRDDLAAAKRAGMRTALYAGDRLSLQASQQDFRDPALKPDRMITTLAQIRDILSIG